MVKIEIAIAATFDFQDRYLSYAIIKTSFCLLLFSRTCALGKVFPGKKFLTLQSSIKSSFLFPFFLEWLVNAIFLLVSGSPTTAIAADSDAIATTPTSRSKQDNNLHLTCVASGYAKYSPYSERKKYSDDGSGATPPLTPNSQNGSTHKLNGAVAKDTNGTGGAEEKSQSIDNGVAETHDNGDVGQTLAEDSNGIINTSLANRNSSNNGRLSANDREIASSEDIDLKIEIEMTRDTTPNINEGKTPEIPADSDSHINGVTTNGDTKDEVDRAALKLDLSLPDSQHKKKEVKIQTPEKLNGVIQNGVQDSPSKKVY